VSGWLLKRMAETSKLEKCNCFVQDCILNIYNDQSTTATCYLKRQDFVITVNKTTEVQRTKTMTLQSEERLKLQNGNVI
jgi:hypothetical protein